MKLETKVSMLFVALMFLSVVAVPNAKPYSTTFDQYGSTTLYMDPVMNGPGDFSVNVTISDVADLYGYEFKVLFRSSLLSATAMQVGDFFPEYWEWKNEVGENYVWLVVTRLPGQSGVSGSGTLATIDFSVVGTGGCYLNLTDTLLGDINAQPIDHVTLDGYFSNMSPTIFLADLVKRKSTNRPGERIFKISQHGTLQTLMTEVKNLGNVPTAVRARFEVFDEGGMPPPGGAIFYSETVILDPEMSTVLTVVIPIDPSMIGFQWYVTVYCEYDTNGDGTTDGTGATIISYSFEVRA